MPGSAEALPDWELVLSAAARLQVFADLREPARNNKAGVTLSAWLRMVADEALAKDRT